jgi:hypothetical protein
LFFFSVILPFSPLPAATIQFTQTSVNDLDATPIAAVSSLAFLESDLSYETNTAPAAFNDLRFTHWTNESAPGIAYRDAWGRSLNPAAFTLTQNTTATAHYLPATRDSDTDNVPDWFELEFYGTLTNGATTDTDSDGFNLLTEFSSGTSPLFGDSTSPGGIAYADSGMVTVNLAGYATYSLTSNPPGTVNQSAVVNPGTVITTPDLSANAAFGYWLIDGVRQADAWGAAHPAVSFTMSGTDRSGVAHLFPGDTDSDGVPDAYEQYYYGTLANPAESDTDGDGLNLLAERTAGTSPLFGDSSSPGGIAWAQTALLTVDANDPPAASPATYTRLTGTPLRIPIPALLAASTSDPDGHPLTVSAVGPSTQGANVRISGSSILYTPANQLDDSFPYTVRDPGGLTATSTITVQVLSPAGKIGTFSLNNSGQPVMQFAGIPSFRYAIERSPDLVSWQTVHTITAPAAGTFSYTDPSPPSGSMYYRMRYLP